MSERNRSLSSGCCGWCFTVACAHDSLRHSTGIFTGMPWFRMITSALHTIPMNTNSHAAQHEVAAHERQDQHVRRNEQPEARVVPVFPRNREVFENDLDREGADQQSGPVPAIADQAGVGASASRAGSAVLPRSRCVHEHAPKGTRIRSRAVTDEVLYEIAAGVRESRSIVPSAATRCRST